MDSLNLNQPSNSDSMNKSIKSHDYIHHCLNPIEKVWRWIKQELTKLEPYPLTVADLKEAVQTLWDQFDPTTWMIKEIETMPEKLRAVIVNRGLATKY